MDDDQIIEGNANQVKHATEYYKSLLGPAPGNILPLNEDFWNNGEKVDLQDSEELIKPFTESEIKEALFHMEKNKTVGPDNIPIEFYQHCWEIIKGGIIEMFDFHAGNLDVSRLNYGIITLLPKIQQFRPMSFKLSLQMDH